MVKILGKILSILDIELMSKIKHGCIDFKLCLREIIEGESVTPYIQPYTKQPNPASCLQQKFWDKLATDKILRGINRKET